MRGSEVSAADHVRTAEQMRRAFDGSFARVPAPRPDTVDLLRLRVNNSKHAVRASEVGAILHCPPVIRPPARARGFVGLAAVRSSLVAIYRLNGGGGAPPDPAPGSWLLVTARDRSVAFVFDELLGYSRVPVSSIHSTQRGQGGEVADIDGTSHPVLRLRDRLDSRETMEPDSESGE